MQKNLNKTPFITFTTNFYEFYLKNNQIKQLTYSNSHK